MDLSHYCVSYTENYFWSQRGIDLVGRGAFGKVHKGRNIKTGEFVAVKTCEKIGDSQHMTEIALLKNLDSPYIVKLISAEKVSNDHEQIVIIMELGDSNVRDELKKLENYYGLPYKMLLLLIKHLEKGLTYLNSKMIAHRDVKPENLLIFNTPEGQIFKLCDFGASRIVSDDSQPLHSICGTPGYLNEYTAGNLARKTMALSYTKDECDLWSVGCTLYECVTGTLPFMPANGPSDVAGMHNMMMSRPFDAICGFINSEGKLIWRKNFPDDRCFYPRSLRHILCEFFRRLFDRRQATRLTFKKFALMCDELVHLKTIRVFKLNAFIDEPFFDTSKASHFERVYFDDYVLIDMPKHDILCLLTLPGGAAITYQPPLLPQVIDKCTDIVVFGVKSESVSSYKMPLSLPVPCVPSTFAMCNHNPTLSEMRLAAAYILNLERQINALCDIVSGILDFSHSICAKINDSLVSLAAEFQYAKRSAEGVRLQSVAISVGRESPQEKRAVENNAQQVIKELNILEDALTWLKNYLLKAIDDNNNFESTFLKKKPTLKKELEILVKMKTCSNSSNGIFESDLLSKTNRIFILHSTETMFRRLSDISSEIRNVHFVQLEKNLRDIFDLSRMCAKKRIQLDESLQLIAVTEDTNRQRLEVVESSGNLNLLSISIASELSTKLKEVDGHARQQKLKASSSLNRTKDMVNQMMMVQV